MSADSTRGPGLQRVLEPEVMDSPDEAREYDAMDHRAVNDQFVDDLMSYCQRQGWTMSDSKNLLDLGTGTAQIPIVLCRRARAWKTVAIDMAVSMLTLARDNIAAAAAADSLWLVCTDAKALSCADGSFDAVISNSIVHHIPQPRAVLAEAVRVARAGGVLFVRDLMRPGNQGTLNQLVELHAATANGEQRRLFAESLHAALTLGEIRALVVELGFDAETVQATSDRHWTWAAIKRT